MRSATFTQRGGSVMMTKRHPLLFQGIASAPERPTPLAPRRASGWALCLLGLLALPCFTVASAEDETSAAQTPVGPQTPAQVPPPTQTPPASAAPSTNPSLPPASRCDAACVRANAERALLACAPRIEAEAATDFDWILRPVPGIFQQADQASATDPVVRYRGDSIRFQTPGKEWVRVSYECGYNVEIKAVAFVNVRPGRLDRPSVSAATQAPAPPRAAQVRAGGVPMRPMASQRPVGNAPPTGGLAAAQPPGPIPQSVTQKTSKAGPVGEPSPIQILQQTPRVR